MVNRLGHVEKRLSIEHNFEGATEKRFQAILGALSFNEMNARRQNLLPASPNTCTWILETAQYKNWMDPPEGPMYVSQTSNLEKILVGTA
ncbi:hypothetical protein F5B19DRAFT_210422 [Rostrohypoxylon terebratum]|nr:hypothetical protein F5B19DRAFT_210422 [Rostrohypoxylon terebratum]